MNMKPAMKYITFVLGFVMFIQAIFCNDGILSKLHQHTYKIKDLRMELMRYNKSHWNFFEIKAFKYNRSTTAHNGTINLKVDMDDKVEVVLQVYKFMSNEYRHFPVRLQLNVQKAFESNAIGLRNIAKCGNLTSFYLYKDITYHTCNFLLDETQFPPLVPNGKYKMEFTFLFLNREIAMVNIYDEVYTPIEYPKK